ncbi:hypothetical protein ABIA60_004134 [Pseudomonas frederiksbergensis]
MFELSSYFGLFLAAFGAATLLPMQSEAILGGMLLSDQYVASTLLAVATIGNVLGATLNWMLGRCVERFRHKRWFPVSESKLKKAQQSYLHHGRWSLVAALGTHHWLSADSRCRSHARATLQFPADRHPRQRGSLSRADRNHTGVGMMLSVGKWIR